MKKKVIALIVACCLVVGGGIGAIFWALAATQVGIKTNLSVSYNPLDNVVGSMSANYQKTTDAAATPFIGGNNGVLNFEYGGSAEDRTLNASDGSLLLNDSDTYVVFEFKFTNNNADPETDTTGRGINVKLTDNGVIKGKVTRKYYFGDLSSKTVAEKEAAIKSNGIENDALATTSTLVRQNQSAYVYMLIEITPGSAGNYDADSSNKFTFTLTANKYSVAKSYLSSGWVTKVGLDYNNQGNVTSIKLTKNESDIPNGWTGVSVGSNTPTYTDGKDNYVQSDSVQDITAYYNSSKTEIVIYSPSTIYGSTATNGAGCIFQGFTGLLTLDLSNFDTSLMNDFNSMFRYCSKLKDLDVSRFDSSNVTDIVAMFQGMSALESLNLGNFDLKSLEKTTGPGEGNVFDNCNKLATIVLPYNVPLEADLLYSAGIYLNGTYVDSEGKKYTMVDGSNCSTETNKVTITKKA